MKLKSLMACGCVALLFTASVANAQKNGATPIAGTAVDQGVLTAAPGGGIYCSICGPFAETNQLIADFSGAAGTFLEVGDDYSSGTPAAWFIANDPVTGVDNVNFRGACINTGNANCVACMDFYDQCGGFVESVCFNFPELGPNANLGLGGFGLYLLPSNGIVMLNEFGDVAGSPGDFQVPTLDLGGFTVGVNDTTSMVVAPPSAGFPGPVGPASDVVGPDPNLIGLAFFGDEITAAAAAVFDGPDADTLPDGIGLDGGGGLLAVGGCCDPNAGACTITSACDCAAIGGTYGGDGTDCTGADTDGDTLPDSCDPCPTDAMNDADGDGFCCATGEDECCADATKQTGGVCGCGIADTDSDGDGVADCVDECPADACKTVVGQCGCGAGIADTANCTTNVEDDADGDGVSDCVDLCAGVDDAVFGPECAGQIPTVSEWGLVVLALLLLVAGKVYFGRRTVLS